MATFETEPESERKEEQVAGEAAEAAPEGIAEAAPEGIAEGGEEVAPEAEA